MTMSSIGSNETFISSPLRSSATGTSAIGVRAAARVMSFDTSARATRSSSAKTRMAIGRTSRSETAAITARSSTSSKLAAPARFAKPAKSFANTSARLRPRSICRRQRRKRAATHALRRKLSTSPCERIVPPTSTSAASAPRPLRTHASRTPTAHRTTPERLLCTPRRQPASKRSLPASRSKTVASRALLPAAARPRGRAFNDRMIVLLSSAESAIDALSYHQLHPRARRGHAVSEHGRPTEPLANRAPRSTLFRVTRFKSTVVAAWSARGQRGRDARERLARAHSPPRGARVPGGMRRRPPRTGTRLFSASSATPAACCEHRESAPGTRSEDPADEPPSPGQRCARPLPGPSRCMCRRPRRCTNPPLSSRSVTMPRKIHPTLSLRNAQNAPVDLTEYTQRAGYRPKPLDVGLGLTLLEHPNGDKIVIGRRRSGEWIYASVPDYEPRLPDESTDQARARLRASIERSKDKGTVVEFVQNRAGNDIPLDWIREHLRDFRAMGRDFDLEAAVDASGLPTPVTENSRRSPSTRRSATTKCRNPSGPRQVSIQSSTGAATIGRRSPVFRDQSDAQRRLERWQKAQAAMDDRRHSLTNQDRLPHPSAVPPTRSPTPKVLARSRFGHVHRDGRQLRARQVPRRLDTLAVRPRGTRSSASQPLSRSWPMKTAVQLRQQSGDGQPKSDLICGVPSSVVTGTLGPVALFDADQIAAYRIRYHRRTRLFVFRTLVVDDRLAASVPGVKPHVQLLLQVHSSGRARLVRELFAYLARTNREPSGHTGRLLPSRRRRPRRTPARSQGPPVARICNEPRPPNALVGAPNPAP